MLGCGRPVRRGDLCNTHDVRRRRGQDLDAPLRPRRPDRQDLGDALQDAALQLWSVVTDEAGDEAFQISLARLYLAADRWARRGREEDPAP